MSFVIIIGVGRGKLYLRKISTKSVQRMCVGVLMRGILKRGWRSCLTSPQAPQGKKKSKNNDCFVMFTMNEYTLIII